MSLQKAISHAAGGTKTTTTTLIEAAKCGNIDKVNELLIGARRAGGENDVNQEGGSNCRDGDVSGGGKEGTVVVVVDPDARNDRGLTAMLLASRHGHFNVVLALIECGADVNAVAPDDGYTALMNVAASAPLPPPPPPPPPPLSEAAATATATAAAATAVEADLAIDAAELLLKHGASVDHAGHDGTTALMEAANRGCGRLVSILLAHGARANRPNNSSENMTALLVSLEHPHVVKCLLEEGGADVHATASAGMNALMLAALAGSAESIALLLDAGACVNDTIHSGDNPHTHGMTALMLAATGGHANVISLLGQRGANVHAKLNGRSALVAAAHGGHTGAVTALLKLDAGSDQNMLAKALSAAISRNNEDCVRLLAPNAVSAAAATIPQTCVLVPPPTTTTKKR